MLLRTRNDAWIIFWRDVMADGYEIFDSGHNKCISRHQLLNAKVAGASLSPFTLRFGHLLGPNSTCGSGTCWARTALSSRSTAPCSRLTHGWTSLSAPT